MYSFVFTNQFKKDFKLCRKRNFSINSLDEVLVLLSETGKTPLRFKPHKLSGDYAEYFECHIKPDWLLIWKVNESDRKSYYSEQEPILICLNNA